MRDTYSLYEAKARLSALVRRVREGAHVIITVHGTPAAELRPIEPEGETIEARLDRLEAHGMLVRPKGTPADLAASPPGPKRPGALKRFLDERD
jgi:prevent-host-death family protein